jgi:hypothetical protein
MISSISFNALFEQAKTMRKNAALLLGQAKDHKGSKNVPTKAKEITVLVESCSAKTLDEFVSSGHAASTKRTHSAALRVAERCGAGSVFPLKNDRLILMIYVMSKSGYALSTIQNYISALKVQNRMEGFADQGAADVQRQKLALMAAAKAEEKPESRAKAPLEIDELRYWASSKTADYAVVSLALTCTFALLRVSEGLSLNLNDISLGEVDGIACHVIIIRKSKTDQQGRGDQASVSCSLGLGMLDSCSCAICPAHSLQKIFLQKKRIDKSGPVFTDSKGARLSYTRVRSCIQNSLGHLVRDPIGTHSFRRTGAQLLFKSGVDLQVIKRCGRWSSDAVFSYLKECQVPLQTRAGLSFIMCK